MSPDDGASLPADMITSTSSLEKDLERTKGMYAKMEETAEKGVAEQNKELEKEGTEYAKDIKENKDWVGQHPFPNPNLKPWTEPPPENNPVQRFGSWASALGILAGAVTHTGLASSLNASAAAMNAIRKNDLDAYHERYNEWKENTEIAIKQADWESKAYQAGWDVMKTNQGLGLGQIKTAAEIAGNTAVLAKLQQGNLKDLFDMTTAIKKFAADGPERQWNAMVVGVQTAAVAGAINQFKRANPNASPQDIANAGLKAVEQIKQDMSPLGGIKNLQNEEAQAAINLANEKDKLIPAGTPADERAALHAKNLKEAAVEAGVVKTSTGSAMQNEQLSLYRARETEKQEAQKTLKGDDLDAKINEIDDRYDSKLLELGKKSNVPGASRFNADIVAIDDLDPLLDAIKVITVNNPETVSVWARKNKYVAAYVGNMGGDLSDDELRSEQVRSLYAMALGPLGRVSGGTGQWTKSREALTKSILEDPQGVLTNPQSIVTDIDTIKPQLSQMLDERKRILRGGATGQTKERNPLGDNSQTPPDTTYNEGDTATNPTTGEVLTYRNGKWVK